MTSGVCFMGHGIEIFFQPSSDGTTLTCREVRSCAAVGAEAYVERPGTCRPGGGRLTLRSADCREGRPMSGMRRREFISLLGRAAADAARCAGFRGGGRSDVVWTKLS